MSAIAKTETETETTPAAITPPSETAAIMSMIQRMSTDPSISIERAEQAFAFYERVQASQARKAFDAAMSAAKAEIPVITKNRKVKFENKGGSSTSYSHEDLGGIADAIDPILSKYGLSYRFRTSSKVNEPVSVTCVLAHEAGYFEETTLSAGRDESGGKNAIQAIGSSVTYLQRYTLKAALGLAVAHDDDAKSVNASDPIDDKQIAEMQRLIGETGTKLDAFLKIAQAESVSDILAKDFDGLKKVLLAKKGNKP